MLLCLLFVVTVTFLSSFCCCRVSSLLWLFVSGVVLFIVSFVSLSYLIILLVSSSVFFFLLRLTHPTSSLSPAPSVFLSSLVVIHYISLLTQASLFFTLAVPVSHTVSAALYFTFLCFSLHSFPSVYHFFIIPTPSSFILLPRIRFPPLLHPSLLF